MMESAAVDSTAFPWRSSWISRFGLADDRRRSLRLHRGGPALRRWVFEISDPIRWAGDDTRGSYWGLLASGPEGYLNQYDKMDPEVPEWQDDLWTPWLDYGPLRLLVMRQWGAWQRRLSSARPGRSV